MAAGWAVHPGPSNGDAGTIWAQPAKTDLRAKETPGRAGAVLDRSNGSSAWAYEVIVRRNVFGLQPAPPAPPPTQPVESPPKEDLQLTGVCDLNSVRSAFFSLVDAGHAADGFVLAEGEQNEWLEVLAVDTAGGTAKVRLKKPVVTIRSVGVEVVLSLQKER